MGETSLGDDAAARGAGEETELDEIGFVDVLDGLDLLSGDGGERLDADRTAFEFLRDGGEDVPVGRFETNLIYLEERERLARDGRGNFLVSVYLGEIADAFQESVATRGVARLALATDPDPSSSMPMPRIRAEREMMDFISSSP